ncbi:hypothetical protein F2P56_035426 [Juglans regia]|uniref:Reverse transcriptase Ty1/copia-type domain-containing protein n=1 Tax=Juglans regia TaxID=51240 RepID=A0A833WBS8_JUGRE|nr:hypothetical protein F2P56_035426 [Juglans regia]
MEFSESHTPPDSPTHSNPLTNPPSRYLNLADPTNPYRLDHSDSPSITLVADLLTTENYTTWSRSMKRALRAKNKLGFIDDTLTKPNFPDGPLIDLWNRCNDMVVSWIQNSITTSLKSSVAFVDDAYEIWMDLHERLSHQNGPRIFQLKKALASLSQENDSVSIYYSNLKTLWDEMAIYEPLPTCSCGTMKSFLDRSQRDCVLQFLMGLNDSYSPIRDQIMLLDPLPPVSKVFSLVQQQERHHRITSHSQPSETLALTVKKPYTPSKSSPTNQTNPRKDRPYCTHCKISGHTVENCFKLGNADPPLCTHCNMLGHSIEKCYKLNGYPPGHKFHNKQPHSSHANLSIAPESVGVGEDKVGLTKLQYQQLLALLQTQDPISANVLHSSSSNPTSQSNMSGILNCFSTHTHASLNSSNTNWIIDTGATDHMVCSTSLFSSIHSTVSYSVKLPNGSSASVTHVGTVHLSNTIILTEVLCVPSFNFNLISVPKLTKSNNCCFLFFSSHCFIQDLHSWTTIGKGDLLHGLYHFHCSVVPPTALTNYFSTYKHKPHTNPTFSASVTQNITPYNLWHCRLGHLSKNRLQLIHDLPVNTHRSFTNEIPCTLCPLAKFNKLPFPDSVHASSRIFEIIHCDIWGPSPTIAHDAFTTSISLHTEPHSYKQAVKDPAWCRAMEAEIAALETNHTWTLTDLPAGKRPIDCKYVYKVKFNSDGTLERLKASLVAKGYTQVEGVDYVDTFSPVAKMVTVRFLISVAAIKGWFLHHFDVNNAFLNGDLTEEIYMKKPPGYTKGEPHQVCKLLKSLYGLKQASRQWNSKLTSSLLSFGFVQSKSDYSLFTKQEGDFYIAILVYVDDILVASNSNTSISSL